MMLIVPAVVLFVGSFFCSAALTALARKITPRFGLVARPKADRYHRTIIPLGGGIAIYGTLAAAILAAVFFIRFVAVPGHVASLAQKANVEPADFLHHATELTFIVVCATILFLVGLWDDKKALGPFFKLVVQWVVALIAVALAGVRVEFFIHNHIVTSFLSAFWIVLIVNTFNFLDNMDGASAGIAAIASGILLTAAAFNGQIFVGGLTIIFIGALLGFLMFNFPPASIFMGDAGSLVVGFFVAVLTLRTTYYRQSLSGPWYPVLMPLIVMAVPLYDFITVCSLRIRQGKSPFVGDTQHFSHRLRRSGLSDRQTALTLYLATLGCGLGATFLYEVSLVGAILIFVQTFLILGLVAVFESTAKAGEK
jgi:UDP-GlcNAc:undecaprenyl-phosphate/decaprenyl-phosphate GlcNAc-1-phosphate transferase